MRIQLRSDEASGGRQTFPGVGENRHDLIARDTGKPLQKVVNAGALFKIFEQRADGNSRALEHPGAADAVRRTFNGGTILPLRHDTSVDLSLDAGNLETEHAPAHRSTLSRPIHDAARRDRHA